MRGVLFAVLGSAVLLAGCAAPVMDMSEPPERPAVPCEMKKLECLVGKWESTAEMPCPETGEPMTYAGGNETEWALGGMFLKVKSWHEMGEGERKHYVEYITWDPKAQKFHAWYFSDWGNYGESWSTTDGECWQFKGKGCDASGAKSTSGGEWKFVDDDTMEWTWWEKGPQGKMELKGTSKRK